MIAMATARHNWIDILATVTLCLSVCEVVSPNPIRIIPRGPTPFRFSLPNPARSRANSPICIQRRSAGLPLSCAMRPPAQSCTRRPRKTGAFASHRSTWASTRWKPTSQNWATAALRGIVISGGIESRVQAAIRFEPVALATLAAVSPKLSASPIPSAAPDRSLAPQQSIAPASPPMQLPTSAPHPAAKTQQASPSTAPPIIDVPTPALPQAVIALTPPPIVGVNVSHTARVLAAPNPCSRSPGREPRPKPSLPTLSPFPRLHLRCKCFRSLRA